MKNEGGSAFGNRRLVIIPLTVCGLIIYKVPPNARVFYSALENVSISTFLYLASGLYLYFYIKNFGRKPLVFCKSGTRMDGLITKHVPSVQTAYRPLYWGAESRCLTIIRNFTPCLGRFQYRREVVKEPHGGQFYLDWCDNNESKRFPDAKTRPTVVILPGVTSHSRSYYIRSIVYRLLQNGYRAVVIIYRGLEEMEVLTPRTYSGTNTTDVELTIGKLRKSFPEAKLFAVGTSLGTLMLGKYLNDSREESGLDGAMFFSCPFNAPICAEEVESFANRLLINHRVAGTQRKMYRRNSQMFDSIVDHEKVMNSCGIREFDHHFTAPIFGYKSAEEYYEDCILDQDKLNSIKIPLLCVGSNDDPFSPEHGLPKHEICNTDHVALVMTYGGGHVSHLQGWNPFQTTYFEQVMLEYFDGLITTTG